jgi:hypothetical protein
MPRVLKTTAAAAAALALSAPAAGQAATPHSGTWVNSSQSNGGEFVTSGRTIKDLRIYCQRTNYELKDFVHASRSGRFSYKGTARRWGPEHQWWGDYTVRVTGRFVSSNRVKITRTAPKCGTATFTVRRSG